MAIGLVAGLVCGQLRGAMMNFSDELESYGQRIGQLQFERSLEARYQGRPGFINIVVYPYRLSGSSAGNVDVHVVSGLFCDGRAEEQNGRMALRYRPAYFVASVPFRPVGKAENTAKNGAGKSFDDVMGYMAQRKSAGITFRYASWWWVTRPTFVWPLGGFVLVGLVWPLVVNLLAFGSFTRPREIKAVKLAAAPRKAAPAPETPTDLDAVEALDREMESVVSGAPAEIPAASESEPRVLVTETVEAVGTGEGVKKEFGAKGEDYYPTELGAKHQA
jgi:hypothetical protein